MTVLTAAAFLIAAVFAALIIKDRLSDSGTTPAPTQAPVAAPASPTATMPMATAAPATPVQATPPAQTVPPYFQANDPNVAGAVDSLLENHDGVYGVLIMRPDGTVLYSKNSQTPFVSASLYKLVLLADIYRKIDRGAVLKTTELPVLDSYFDPANGEDSFFTADNVGENFTVERLLFAAGAYSSNVAAKMLLTLTDPASLAEEAALLGMTGTHLFVNPAALPGWPPAAAPDSSPSEVATAAAFDVNEASSDTTSLTTPADMARYFRLLLSGNIVSKTASSEILSTLKTQMVDNRFPVLLPPGTEMAHKTGDLDYVVHDVGVIYAPSGPIILIAMAEGDSNDNFPIEIEQRLALIAYGDFDVPAIDVTPDVPTAAAADGNAG